MAIQGSQAEPPAGYPRYDDNEAEHGYGWVMFAGVLLLMLGTLNFIEGVAAISNSHFFVHDTHYILGSLKTWGWIALIVGCVELLVGLGVFVKNQLARWVGVLVLAVNAIVQLLLMPAYPFWSLTIFTLDILAIFALVTYGGRISDAS
jgi:hypothetical protein